jgi:23S rRNA-/tRNA-specific pseudouridylate synthase
MKRFSELKRSLIRIVYEDDHFLFLNKPGNISTSGDASGLNLHDEVQRYAAECRWAMFPQLIHRLDRPVSGLLIYPKSLSAAKHVRKLMAEHTSMLKEYVAITIGTPEQPSGVVAGGIFKHRTIKQRYCIYESGGGKSVETRYKVLKSVPSPSFGSLSVLALRLTTGRTHQLRATCAHLRTPVLGDELYGGKKYAETLLHAAKVQFVSTYADSDYQLVLPPPWIDPLTDAVDIKKTGPTDPAYSGGRAARTHNPLRLPHSEPDAAWAAWNDPTLSDPADDTPELLHHARGVVLPQFANICGAYGQPMATASAVCNASGESFTARNVDVQWHLAARLHKSIKCITI